MNLYQTIKPEILSDIESFSKRNGISIFQKIKAEEDLLNLKSLLTEYHFGIYFEQVGYSIKYNQKLKFTNLTPDYQFTLNGQEIIAEVCHINPTQNDIKKQKADDAEYLKFKTANPYHYTFDGPNTIEWKPQKVGGANGSLAQKANKYGPVAGQMKLPLLLCVYLEFTTAIDSVDVNHSLYGHPAEFIGNFPLEGYFPGTKFHDLTKALFYTNNEMRCNVSGVLLRNNNGSFSYYNNYSDGNRLLPYNKNFFIQIQHPYI